MLRHRTSAWYFSAVGHVLPHNRQSVHIHPASSNTSIVFVRTPKSHSCTHEAITKPAEAYDPQNFSRISFAGYQTVNSILLSPMDPVRFIVLRLRLKTKPDTDVEYSGLIDFAQLYARYKRIGCLGR